MTAGARTSKVTFETATATQDDYGEEQQTWGFLGVAWAQVFWGRGDERRQAATEQGAQAATFQVLDNAMTRAVTIRDRLTLDGDLFDIVGIAPDTPKRGHIEFTATRAL
ncbi:MAG: head-tail adaptor protein [Pseudomonadota bacterium]